MLTAGQFYAFSASWSRIAKVALTFFWLGTVTMLGIAVIAANWNLAKIAYPA